MEKFKHVERTRLAGCIVSMQMLPNVTLIRLAVTTGGVKAYPMVTVYDRSLTDGFKVRDNVIVTGRVQIRGFRRGEKLAFQNVVVATDIKPRYRALNDYIDIPETRNHKGAIPDDVNDVFIIGSVNSVYVPESRRGSLALVNVRVEPEDDSPSNKEIAFFQRYSSKAAGLVKGDIIAVCGSVMPAKKPSSDGVVDQNIVCRDMLVLKKADRPRSASPDAEKDEPDVPSGKTRPGKVTEAKTSAMDEDSAARDEEAHPDGGSVTDGASNEAGTEEDDTDARKEKEKPGRDEKDGSVSDMIHRLLS